jgi:hypothetical protein
MKELEQEDPWLETEPTLAYFQMNRDIEKMLKTRGWRRVGDSLFPPTDLRAWDRILDFFEK